MKTKVAYSKIPNSIRKKGATVGDRFAIFDCGLISAVTLISLLARKRKFSGVSGTITNNGKTFYWCFYGMLKNDSIYKQD